MATQIVICKRCSDEKEVVMSTIDINDLEKDASTGPNLLELMTQMSQSIKNQRLPLYPIFPVRNDVLELLKTQKEYRVKDGKMLYAIMVEGMPFKVVELILTEGK